MTYKEARELIPNPYYLNTWYPGQYNGREFEICVRKGGYLWLRIRGFYNWVNSVEKTKEKRPCWKYYRTNKKNQWIYVDFDPIYNEEVC